ncbi:cupin domain-containing protein [Caballeronia sp. J97]|uniref:cupin domain-containing protein n=1 Tax=Caballeronia sp. J97 TaxID=2805429 RepID=UPI002AB2708A|nr:cupin domain-containing protein [Caballeronia sp. J97]
MREAAAQKQEEAAEEGRQKRLSKRRATPANAVPNIERPPLEGETQDALDIGNRLRELRTKHGLSIRALAEVAGLTHSTIAQIEANKTSPSVGSMKRILDALHIPLSQFFADAEAQTEEQVFFAADELVELADGNVLSYRQVGKNLAGKDIMMLRERYAPGADTGEPYSHQAEECGTVISGRLMIVVGTRERCLSAGEAYYFDSRVPHRMYNPFDEVCEVVSAVSPPTF